ncbi:MAG: type II secretion system protein GspG, partial [Chthoniobacterales bacterium]
LEARGEKLSLVDFIPSPIPDEENFFMSPLFVDMFKPPYHSLEGGFGVEQMKIKAIGEGEGHYIISGTKDPRDAKGLTNLNAFAARLRTETNKNQSAFKVIISAFEARQDLWNALYKAAEKPDARFPTQYEKNYEAPLPHLSSIMSLSQMLSLRSVAYMEAGDSRAAARDLRLILRLSDSLAREPLLIAALIRFSAVQIVSLKIWEGIQRHAWSAEQLQDFEKQLALQKPRDWLTFTLRGARGSTNAWISEVINGNKNSKKMLAGNVYGIVTKAYEQKPWWAFKQDIPWWTCLIPWDRLYSDMALNAWQVQTYVDFLSASDGVGINVGNIPKELNTNVSWRYPLLHWGLGSLGNDADAWFPRKYALIQVSLDMARIACALECYRLANGAYPEKLDALVPQYIQKLPNDVASGKSYHYRRNASDNFTLWSVGYDGVDDHATPVVREHKEGDLRKGDWVWGKPMY